MRISSALSKLFTLVSLGALGACADNPTQLTGMATPSVVSLAKGGNSANAKLCQQGGYRTVVTATGASFANEGECVSYGAAGGDYAPAATLVATLTVDPNGDFFDIRVLGTGLQPGSDVSGYVTTSLGLSSFTGVAHAGADGTVDFSFGVNCGLSATNGYGVATTLGGATIESNHIYTIC